MRFISFLSQRHYRVADSFNTFPCFLEKTRKSRHPLSRFPAPCSAFPSGTRESALLSTFVPFRPFCQIQPSPRIDSAEENSGLSLFSVFTCNSGTSFPRTL